MRCECLQSKLVLLLRKLVPRRLLDSDGEAQTRVTGARHGLP